MKTGIGMRTEDTMTDGRATTVMCKIRGDTVKGRTTGDVARDTTVDGEIPDLTGHAEEAPMSAAAVVANTSIEYDRLVYGRQIPWPQRFCFFMLQMTKVRC